jgi:hypothetical protein
MSEAGRSQLFHGARLAIQDTHVRPPSVTGANPASSRGFSSGSDRPPHTDLAFATDSERIAWRYAQAVPGSPHSPVNNDPDPKYRSRVYSVAPAADQVHNVGEIESPTGFKITGEHHAEVGATGTFPQVNWNAYKAKVPGRQVVSGDKNHSYMESDAKPAYEPPVDHVHPNQLNVFSGKTRAEQETYEKTPGASIHMGKQFSEADLAAHKKDPASVGVRRRQKYHEYVDKPLGTVV